MARPRQGIEEDPWALLARPNPSGKAKCTDAVDISGGTGGSSPEGIEPKGRPGLPGRTLPAKLSAWTVVMKFIFGVSHILEDGTISLSKFLPRSESNGPSPSQSHKLGPGRQALGRSL